MAFFLFSNNNTKYGLWMCGIIWKNLKSDEDQELYEPESDNEDVLYIPTSNQEFSKMDIPQVYIENPFFFSIFN